jgi:hypothetical protein
MACFSAREMAENALVFVVRSMQMMFDDLDAWFVREVLPFLHTYAKLLVVR